MTTELIAQARECTKVIGQIMEFISAHPAAFDPGLAERRVKARLDQIDRLFDAALAAQPAAEREPFDPLGEFGFMLEQRRDVWVIVDDCGGTTPASLTERVMWDAIVTSRGITATSGKESGNG